MNSPRLPSLQAWVRVRPIAIVVEASILHALVAAYSEERQGGGDEVAVSRWGAVGVDRSRSWARLTRQICCTRVCPPTRAFTSPPGSQRTRPGGSVPRRTKRRGGPRLALRSEARRASRPRCHALGLSGCEESLWRRQPCCCPYPRLGGLAGRCLFGPRSRRLPAFPLTRGWGSHACLLRMLC